MREYFGTIIPAADNKFAALNSAVWSGGSFVYVPKGVHVDIPLQAYFRINAQNMGQFERTLIIVEEGASMHYVEGCTAPIYSSNSLHSAVVEIIVKKGARCRYTTIQNWCDRRLQPGDQARRGLRRRHDGVDRRQPGQQGDDEVPGRLHARSQGARRDPLDRLRRQRSAPGRGRQGCARRTHTPQFQIDLQVDQQGRRPRLLSRPAARWPRARISAKSNVVCDALLLDEKSRSDTYPYIEIEEDDVSVGHEASVSKIGEEQLFYLMSRGTERG